MSTLASPPRRLTPDDLLRMPDGERYELVDGALVERNTGWNSSYIGGRVHFMLSQWSEQHPIGVVAPADAGYRCFPDDPGKVRRPDASFLRFDRLPPADEREGFCPVAPDVAVEVVSPNDLYSEVEEKVAEYLTAGVQRVWVINPPTQTLRVHRHDGVIDLTAADELMDEELLPGFRCRVAEFFRIPGQSQATPGE
jgi:Uma2 family endonuclease